MAQLLNDLAVGCPKRLDYASQRGAPAPISALTAGLLPMEETRGLAPRWARLSERALIPALGSSAAWVGTMLAALEPAGSRVMLLAATRAHDHELAGMAVMERRWPLPLLASWHPPLMFAGTPLLHRADAVGAIGAMLRGARRDAGARALLFRRIEIETELLEAFASAADELGVDWALLDPRRSAALRPHGTYEDWFAASFSRARRKEFRRLRARLAEEGALESAEWQPDEPLKPWISDFLALEKAGWKGRRGTAIGCDRASAEFLGAALNELALRDELLFWRLCLDGRPIAMLFGLVAGGRAWLVKMAYDEAFARYSPGVLIILDATRSLFQRSDISLADSCATPDHPMIDRIWRDRIAVGDLLIATPGTSSALFRTLHGLERAHRAARSTLKSLYHRHLNGTLK